MGYVFKNGVLTKQEEGSEEEKPAGESVLEKPEKPAEPVHKRPSSRSKKDKSKNEEENS